VIEPKKEATEPKKEVVEENIQIELQEPEIKE
jgi:hypothetical protein